MVLLGSMYSSTLVASTIWEGNDLHGVNGLAAEHAEGHVEAVLDHQGAVERGAGMDLVGLFLDDVEVLPGIHRRR